MKKTFKVVMLPTEKASDLCLYTPQTHDVSNNILNYGNYNQRLYGLDKKPLYQHIYILSDDEIKEGDWFIGLDNKVYQCKPDMIGTHKKIIATTDKSLGITDYRVSPVPNFCDMPQLHESFIKAYVNSYNEGKPITEVDLEMEEIIYPFAQIRPEVKPIRYYQIKTRPDNTVIVHQSKTYTKDDVERLIKRFQFDQTRQEGLPVEFCDNWIKNNL